MMIEPLKPFWSPLTVGEELVKAGKNVSKAATEPPMLPTCVTVIAILPGFADELVVNVVVLPETVATTASLGPGGGNPNDRMVAALADVDSASEAKHAAA